jgi:hypothetical protein
LHANGVADRFCPYCAAFLQPACWQIHLRTFGFLPLPTLFASPSPLASSALPSTPSFDRLAAFPPSLPLPPPLPLLPPPPPPPLSSLLLKPCLHRVCALTSSFPSWWTIAAAARCNLDDSPQYSCLHAAGPVVLEATSVQDDGPAASEAATISIPTSKLALGRSRDITPGFCNLACARTGLQKQGVERFGVGFAVGVDEPVSLRTVDAEAFLREFSAKWGTRGAKGAKESRMRGLLTMIGPW